MGILLKDKPNASWKNPFNTQNVALIVMALDTCPKQVGVFLGIFLQRHTPANYDWLYFFDKQIAWFAYLV